MEEKTIISSETHCTPQQLSAELNLGSRGPSFISKNKDQITIERPFSYTDWEGKQSGGPIFIVKDEKYNVFCEKYYKEK